MTPQGVTSSQPFAGGDPADHYRDREFGPGRAVHRGRLLAWPRRPRPPRDGAWARRLAEIRVERELDG